MELLLIERMNEVKVLFNLKVFKDLNKAELIELFRNCAHKRRIDTEITLDTITKEGDFIHIYRVLKVYKESLLLIPLAAVSVVLLVVSEDFIIIEWFNLESLFSETYSIFDLAG